MAIDAIETTIPRPWTRPDVAAVARLGTLSLLHTRALWFESWWSDIRDLDPHERYGPELCRVDWADRWLVIARVQDSAREREASMAAWKSMIGSGTLTQTNCTRVL